MAGTINMVLSGVKRKEEEEEKKRKQAEFQAYLNNMGNRGPRAETVKTSGSQAGSGAKTNAGGNTFKQNVHGIREINRQIDAGRQAAKTQENMRQQENSRGIRRISNEDAVQKYINTMTANREGVKSGKIPVTATLPINMRYLKNLTPEEEKKMMAGGMRNWEFLRKLRTPGTREYQMANDYDAFMDAEEERLNQSNRNLAEYRQKRYEDFIRKLQGYSGYTDEEKGSWGSGRSDAIQNDLILKNFRGTMAEREAKKRGGELDYLGDYAWMSDAGLAAEREKWQTQLDASSAPSWDEERDDRNARSGRINEAIMAGGFQTDGGLGWRENRGDNYGEGGSDREDADRALYDYVMGEGAYDQAVEALETDEDVEDLEARMERAWDAFENQEMSDEDRGAAIYEAITGGNWQQEDNAYELAKANRRIAQGKLDQISFQESNRQRYNELMSGTHEGDASYHPEFVDSKRPIPMDGFYANSSTADIYEVYSYINGGKVADYWRNKDGELNVQEIYRNAGMMLDPEIEEFNRLFNKNPDNPTEAQAFLDGLQWALNARYRVAEEIVNRDMAHRLPILSTAMTFMDTVGESGTFLAGRFGDLIGADWQKDPNSFLYRNTRHKQDTRGQVTEDLPEGWKTVYGAATSGIDSALNLLVAKGTGATGKALETLTLTLFGTQAFQNSMYQHLNETEDYGRAVFLSAVDTLIEEATEIWSVENLLGDPTDLWKYLMKNAFSEGSEELAGSTVGELVKALASGKASWQERGDQIFDAGGYYGADGKWVDLSGLDDNARLNEAHRQALREWEKEIVDSTLSGALSTGGGAIVGPVRNIGNRIQTGGTISGKSGGINSLVEAAGKMKEGTKSRKQAEAIMKDMAAGKPVSNYRIGRLAESIYLETGEKIGETTKGVLSEKITRELMEGGMEKTEAMETADAIAKARMEGPQNLTKEEQEKITGSELAMSTLGDYLINKTTNTKVEEEIESRSGNEMAARQTVEQLTQKEGEAISAAVGDVAEAVKESRKSIIGATELALTGGKRTGNLDAVVDGEIRQISGIRDGKLVVTDRKGNETTVESGTAKFVNGTVAAAVRLTETRDDLISGRYANQMIQAIGKIKSETDGVKALDDMMKIRLAAMSEGQLPETVLDKKTAQALYDDARAEYAENDENRVVSQETLKPGQGVAAYNGAEYGTAAYNQQMKGLSKKVRDQAGALSEIAVRAGFRVNFINEAENSDIFGWEDAKTGTVTVNLAAAEGDANRNLLTIASHEFTHWLEQNSQEGYAALRSFILSSLRKSGKNVEGMLTQLISERNTIFSEQGREEKLDLNGAMAELVANACDQVLGNKQVIDTLKNENPSLYNKARQFVKDFVARIRNAVSGMKGSTTRESRAMMDYADELARLWLGAREEALGRETGAKTEDPAGMTDEQLEKRYAAAQEGYRFEKNLEKNLNLFAKNMQAFKKQFKADDVVIGETFQVLQDIGIDNKPMVINQKHLEQALVHPKDADHKMTVKQMMEIIAKANNPIAVIRSDSHSTNSLVEIVDYEINGNVVVVPIEISTSGLVNTIRIDTNRMSSAYGKKGIASMIAGAVNTELAGIEPGIYYTNKKKTSFLRSRGLQLPDSSKNSGLVHKITDNKGFVKQTNTRKTETSAVMKKMYSAAQKDTEQDRLLNGLTEVKNRMNELKEARRALKQEADQWVERISEAGEGSTDKLLEDYKRWEESSGYADITKKIQEAEEEFRKANKAYDDYVEQRDVEEERRKIKESGLTEAEWRRKQAVKEFGYTPNFTTAGYLLPDGKMLNFSGMKGRTFGQRGQDHRAISTVFASREMQGGKAMVAFMSQGNIRIMAETPGIDISTTTEPTAQQYNQIRNMAQRFADEEYFNIDFTDERGNTVDSIEYDGRVSGTKIVNDIKQFFKTGEAPQQSLVSQFHYSAAQRDEEYMKAAETGDLETARKLVDEKAEEAFRNSKARTKNGKLMRVYHGTAADFNEFDTSVSGGKNGTAEGFGIYLTDDESIPKHYGNRVISGYANIQRPAYTDRKTFKRNELAKVIKETCRREAQEFVDDGSYDNIREAMQDTWISNYVYTPDYRTIDEAIRAVADTILEQNDNDSDIIGELLQGQGVRNYGRAMEFYHEILTPLTGFDGIWAKWTNRQDGSIANVLLAFDSSQIKEADPITRDDDGNIIPLSERFNTEKKDIRYSMSQVSQTDQEYADAVARGDMKRATDMLMEKLKNSQNIIPFNAPNWYGGEHKDIARLIKNGTPEAVARAAADMASFVPDNAVLIPMPPHEGMVKDDTDTKILAEAIGELTGRPVVVALESDPRESRYKAKSEGRKGVRAEDMGFRMVEDLPEGTIPIFIDNVVGSGETAKAALQAAGGGITLSYAKSTLSKGIEGLKRATVTYDKQGNLIPLSQRFDASRRDIRYSMNQAMEKPVDSFTGEKPFEARKDGLVAVHNLNERGLMADLKMNGFPMPSVAVVRKSDAWDSYGPISVFFGRDSVDPEFGNDLFGGDAFTPTLGAAQVSSADEALDVLRSKKRRDLSYAGDLYEMLRSFKRVPDIETARRRAYYYGADGIESRLAAEEQLEKLEKEIWDKIKRNLGEQLNMTAGEYRDNHMQYYISQGIMEAIEQIEIMNSDGKMSQLEKDSTLENVIRKKMRDVGLPEFELDWEGDEYNAIYNYIDYFNEHNGSWMQESKPDRVVDLDEIRAVLLPDDVSQELLDGLKAAGIGMDRIGFYRAGSKAERSRKMKAIPDTIAGVAFSAAQADMEVNQWMMSLNEKTLNTVQERNLLKQYKDARVAVDLARKALSEYEAEIRRIEKLENPTPYDREKLRKQEEGRDRWVKKLDKAEADLARITSDKGYASLMMRQQRLMNDLISGRTAEEVISTAEAIEEKMKEVDRAIARRAEELRKLDEKAEVAAAKSYFAGTNIKEMASHLKSEYQSDITASDIENRLAAISLKLMKNNFNMDEVMDDMEELAARIAGKRQADYESYAIEELRGTYALSESQMKELKGQHRTLRDLQRELAGTGIRFRKAKPGETTLDSVYGQLRERIPSLEDVSDKDQVDAIINLVRAEKRAGMMIDEAGLMEDLRAEIMTSAIGLTGASEAENGGNSQVKSLMKSLEEIRNGGLDTAEAIEDVRKQLKAIVQEAGKAREGALKIGNDVGDAIRYFNAITEQSEAATWRSERNKLILQMKDENTMNLLKEQEKWKQRIERDKTIRKMMEENFRIRNQISLNVTRIRKLLENETDQKNVPEHLKGLAREMVRLIVDNELREPMTIKVTSSSVETLERTRELLNIWREKEGDFDIHDLSAFADPDIQETAADALADIEDGLGFLYNRRGDDRAANLQAMKNAISRIKDGVTTISSIIKAESSIVIQDRRIAIEDAAYDILTEAEKSRFKGEYSGKLGKTIATIRKAIVSGNMTPVYFFKNLRNSGLSRQWREFERGENRNGLELQKAREFMERTAAETGYATWDLEKRYDVSLSGYKAKMTLEQMMALYATWKRENTLGPEMSNHLINGGVYVDEGGNDEGMIGRVMNRQRAHKMTKDDAKALEAMLTAEQKEYVNLVVGYLSKEMSELGNEASMRMYGIEKYKEDYYFPMKIWNGIRNTKSDAGAGGMDENRIAHQSFSKRRVNKAKNALVIGNFTDTAVGHMVQMINYVTMAPAIENLNRVLNFQVETESGTKQNVETAFGESYGEEARKYLRQWMQDLNGGVTQDPRKTLREKALSTFKKNAVAGSLSVAMQQPLSYVRAAVMVNPKYLARALSPKYWKGSYEEMMRNSGVAVIKNMGRFDMSMGQSAKEYLAPEKKTGKARAAMNWISDKSTILPEMMDRMTWTRMWSAVKAETADRMPGVDQSSDQFMFAVAERFNELMRRTQVYDSTLVKSSNMRSQNYAMKVLTSFMAEPTLTLNMLGDAVANAKEKGGKLMLARAGAAFAASAVLQAVIKGLMGAGRSPDDKKTWEENFLNRFGAALLNEANPISLIPGYSDLIEVLKNGELQDDAMGALGKIKTIIDTTGKIIGGNGKGAYRDLEDTAGQLAQLFTNVPVKNIMRDMRAMYNTFAPGTYAGRETSGAVVRYQARDTIMTGDNLLGVVNAWLGEAGYKVNNDAYYRRIYAADRAGNTKASGDMIEYLIKGKGAKAETIQTKLRGMAKSDEKLGLEEKIDTLNAYGASETGSVILDEYTAGKVGRKEAERLYRREKPKATDKDVMEAFDKADRKARGEDTTGYTNYTPLREAMDANKADQIRQAVTRMMDNGYKGKDIKTWITTNYKAAYLEAKDGSPEKVKIRDAIEKAYKAAGFTAEDAKKTVEGWNKDKKAGAK